MAAKPGHSSLLRNKKVFLTRLIQHPAEIYNLGEGMTLRTHADKNCN